MDDLDSIVVLLKQHIAKYEQLQEAYFRAPYTEYDTKVKMERELRILRVSLIHPAIHRMYDVVYQLMRDAQDRAYKKVMEKA